MVTFELSPALRSDTLAKAMNLPVAAEDRARVEEFRRKHRTGLLTLVFTDLVGSTTIKQALGDRDGVALIQNHQAQVRELLGQFQEAEEISTAGDSFFLVFVKPSDAVRFALLLQNQLRALGPNTVAAIRDRIGIHIGEVVIEEREGTTKPRDLYGLQVDTCARVMSLAQADQILLTRSAFDNARQVLKGEELAGLRALTWLNHGPYVIAGLEEPQEVCEVGETGLAHLQAPADAPKAQRKVSAEEEPVLGWRPAVDQLVPNTQWVLEKKLGEGGFGEVWVGRHQKLKERRVFKFCFRADRVRSLKREMTLFRVIKERIGDHPNIVRLLEVYFEEPPFYVVMDHVEGQDLKSWWEQQGGAAKVPLASRLEIVAQIADALQAAHDAGVIHRDVKPGNILVSGEWPVTSDEKDGEPPEVPPPRSSLVTRHSSLSAKLTDFGIGQVVSEEALKGVTKAGFTQTILADSSSSQTGSQMYMAPELLAGKPASTRSDIYSLGVVLYQVLVGDFTRPITTDWQQEVTDPLLRDDLKHCFAGNPQDRFAGAGQLAKNLRALPERQAALAKEEAELAAREKAAYRRGMMRVAVVAMTVLAGVALLALYAFQQAQRAARNATEANRNAQEANLQRIRAEDFARELHRNLYIADMNVANQALNDGDLGRAMELVRNYLPRSGENDLNRGPKAASYRVEEDLRGWEWRYLWQRCQGDSAHTFGGHTSFVTCAVLGRNGSLLATAGFDQTVRVWDFAERRFVTNLTGFAKPILRNSVAFSPDGLMLAVADRSQISLWDTSTWQKLRVVDNPASEGQWFSLAVAFSPDGKTLACNNAGSIKMWDSLTGQPRATRFTVAQPDYGQLLVYSPDGKLVATGAADRIVVWDVASESPVEGFSGRLIGPTSVAFSPDGALLAAVGISGQVMLWDAATRQESASFQAAPRYLAALAFSQDGKTLATGAADQAIQLWNTATHEHLGTLIGHQNSIWSLAFGPDGRSLVSGSKDGTARLWNPQAKVAKPELPSGLSPLWLSPDSQTLLTVNTNAIFQYWNIPSRREIRAVKPPWVLHRGEWLVNSRDGALVARMSTNNVVQIWNLEAQKPIATFELQPASAVPGAVAFSSDNRAIVISKRAPEQGNRIDAIEVWDLVSTQRVAVIEGTFTRPFLSADGRLLAAGYNHDVKLFDFHTRREVATFRGHKWTIAYMAFSPDDKVLATTGRDNDIRLWELATGEEKHLLKGHKTAVGEAAFSPDGRTLASWEATLVKFWNVAAGKELLTLEGLDSSMGHIMFSRDGRVFVAGTSPGNVSSEARLLVIEVPGLEGIDSLENSRADVTKRTK